MGRPVKGPCGGCGASDGDCYNLVVHMRQGVCCSYCYHPLVPDPPLRPDWDEYFLDIAKAVATRADCTRRHAGAVIVGDDHRIVSTGYNGAPSGELGCLTAGACPRGRQTTTDVTPGSSYDTGAGSCIAVHAEANALIYGEYARFKGATIYVVSLTPDGSLHEQQSPCGGCERLIKGAGIARVVTP